MAAGLISSGTSGIGGLVFGNPGYNSAPIDQGTQNLVNQQANQATTQGSSQYAANDLNGTSQNVDTTGAQNKANALGGPSDANMQAALQARAQRTMNSSVNQLQRQAQVQGIGQQANQMQNAFGDVTGVQNANNANNQAQVQAYQNNQNTRNSIISGLFGAAGTAAGFAGGGSGGNVNSTAAPLSMVNGPQGAGYEGEVDLSQ